MDKLCSDEEIQMAFAMTLEMILPNIQPYCLPNHNGLLTFGIPFCGGFVEAGTINNFLKKHMSTFPGVRHIHVHAHDIGHTAHCAISALADQPNITYAAEDIDLINRPSPPCEVTLGIHPMITGQGWETITLNVLRTSKISVFFMFAEVEAQTLKDICDRNNFSCQVQQNPYGRAQLVPQGVDPNAMKRYNWIGVCVPYAC